MSNRVIGRRLSRADDEPLDLDTRVEEAGYLEDGTGTLVDELAMLVQRMSDLVIDRRESNRVTVRSVASSLGPVVDLSEEGAKIISPKGPFTKGPIRLCLSGHGIETPEIEGEIMWSRARSRGYHVAGLRLPSAGPYIAQLIEADAA